MSDALLAIDCEKVAGEITGFLKEVFGKTGKRQAVIGWSGGIDSTVSLFLLAKVLPPENIHVVHMPYTISFMGEFGDIQKLLQLPHVEEHPIVRIADVFREELNLGDSEIDKIRFGNIMARIRMIILFDKARAVDGLVCGTENKSEHLLGYFTRYGDGASDIEPIVGLYKTQVYQLARYLGVPEQFISKAPSAGLWAGQTDEGEFGFSYQEADAVCHLYFDQHRKAGEIMKQGYSHTNEIITFAKKNSFKLKVPYVKE